MTTVFSAFFLIIHYLHGQFAAVFLEIDMSEEAAVHERRRALQPRPGTHTRRVARCAVLGVRRAALAVQNVGPGG